MNTGGSLPVQLLGLLQQYGIVTDLDFRVSGLEVEQQGYIGIQSKKTRQCLAFCKLRVSTVTDGLWVSVWCQCHPFQELRAQHRRNPGNNLVTIFQPAYWHYMGAQPPWECARMLMSSRVQGPVCVSIALRDLSDSTPIVDFTHTPLPAPQHLLSSCGLSQPQVSLRLPK